MCVCACVCVHVCVPVAVWPQTSSLKQHTGNLSFSYLWGTSSAWALICVTSGGQTTDLVLQVWGLDERKRENSQWELEGDWLCPFEKYCSTMPHIFMSVLLKLWLPTLDTTFHQMYELTTCPKSVNFVLPLAHTAFHDRCLTLFPFSSGLCNSNYCTQPAGNDHLVNTLV